MRVPSAVRKRTPRSPIDMMRLVISGAAPSASLRPSVSSTYRSPTRLAPAKGNSAVGTLRNRNSTKSGLRAVSERKVELPRRDYWDKWSTQLADTVTILNQKNQLKQNEIDNDSKQANRHFDLGTNALRKMNEMLMSIGRM